MSMVSGKILQGSDIKLGPTGWLGVGEAQRVCVCVQPACGDRCMAVENVPAKGSNAHQASQGERAGCDLGTAEGSWLSEERSRALQVQALPAPWDGIRSPDLS